VSKDRKGMARATPAELSMTESALDALRQAALTAARSHALPLAMEDALWAVGVLLSDMEGYAWLPALQAALERVASMSAVRCAPCDDGGHDGAHWYPGCTCAAGGNGQRHSSHCDLYGRRLRYGNLHGE